MNITDSPHPAGTPEHGEWVRTVYMPAVSDERFDIDAQRVGAASIGRELIHGGRDLVRLFIPPPLYTIDIDEDGYKRMAQAIEEMADVFAELKAQLAGIDMGLVRWMLACVPGPATLVVASQRRRRHR